MTLLEKGEHFHFPISVYPRLPCNQSKFLVKSGILDTLDRERELSENKGMIWKKSDRTYGGNRDGEKAGIQKIRTKYFKATYGIMNVLLLN